MFPHPEPRDHPRTLWADQAHAVPPPYARWRNSTRNTRVCRRFVAAIARVCWRGPRLVLCKSSVPAAGPSIMRPRPRANNPSARERPNPRMFSMTLDLHPVKPLPGLAPWLGGKRNLASRLAGRIAAIPHALYAEPFLGMGGVFFRRATAAPVEAVNDKAGEVVNLFRVVRHHPEALLTEMRLQLASRQEFQRLLATSPETLTDVQRAARFLALQRLVYGGKPGSSSFPARPTRARGFGAEGLRRLVEAAHDRLANVTIEHLDYGAFIARYDRSGTLFYLDPPYWGCEAYYGKELFARDDFARLADLLAGIKGRFLMSINDAAEIRCLFGRFRIEEEPVTYRVGGAAKPVVELVISN
ncbi:DNA adenine methylase [Azospirillaceae bacterium]